MFHLFLYFPAFQNSSLVGVYVSRLPSLADCEHEVSLSFMPPKSPPRSSVGVKLTLGRYLFDLAHFTNATRNTQQPFKLKLPLTRLHCPNDACLDSRLVCHSLHSFG